MKAMHSSFKIMLLIINLYLSACILSGCSGESSAKKTSPDKTLKGHFSVSGAFALYPLTVKWAEEFQKSHPGVRIDISAGGAGKGMMDVLSNMVDLAMFSRSVTEVEEKKGAWKVAVAKDAVLPTMNSKNPLISELLKTGISKETFRQICIDQSVKSWNKCVQAEGQLYNINVYTRSDACGAAEMWGLFLGSNQESLNGIGVFGDPGIAEAVKNDPLGTGYNNVIYAYDITSRKQFDGLSVIPIDLNGNHKIDEDEAFYESLDDIMKAIGDGKYPSPPARELYFISNGKPTNEAVLAFLEWILTDGQQFVNEAGYVRLPDETIRQQLTTIQ
ncbi:MAG: PstS family phosphate ABC transporter substrate-binding protein [Bacteroidales bacterium]|nr:PstS family phosphate ABC transporter substrate-binding protein [Bacteroidales bacterium]